MRVINIANTVLNLGLIKHELQVGLIDLIKDKVQFLYIVCVFSMCESVKLLGESLGRNASKVVFKHYDLRNIFAFLQANDDISCDILKSFN